MDREIIKEDCERLTVQMLRELLKETDELHCRDRARVDEVGLEASVYTDAGDERLGLDSDLALLHGHALVWRCSGLGREGVEGEDCLIHKHYLHIV